MYESFFEFSERPFSAEPDVAFQVDVSTFRNAADAVARCIEGNRGIAVVTAPAGLGKSLLGLYLASQLEHDFRVVMLANANVSTPTELLQAILFELGIGYTGLTAQELRLDLTSGLRSIAADGTMTVLIVDEAHLLGTGLLEELRTVTNITSNARQLVRLVLIGQPSLEEHLTDASLSAFMQRVGCQVDLEHLTVLEARQYVAIQLGIAGAESGDVFTDTAIDFIVRASDGLPRCLNQLCDHSLLLAWLAREKPVTASHARAALNDLKQLPLHWIDPGDVREPDSRLESAGDSGSSPRMLVEAERGDQAVPQFDPGDSDHEIDDAEIVDRDVLHVDRSVDEVPNNSVTKDSVSDGKPSTPQSTVVEFGADLPTPGNGLRANRVGVDLPRPLTSDAQSVIAPIDETDFARDPIAALPGHTSDIADTGLSLEEGEFLQAESACFDVVDSETTERDASAVFEVPTDDRRDTVAPRFVELPRRVAPPTDTARTPEPRIPIKAELPVEADLPVEAEVTRDAKVPCHTDAASATEIGAETDTQPDAETQPMHTVANSVDEIIIFDRYAWIAAGRNIPSNAPRDDLQPLEGYELEEYLSPSIPVAPLLRGETIPPVRPEEPDELDEADEPHGRNRADEARIATLKQVIRSDDLTLQPDRLIDQIIPMLDDLESGGPAAPVNESPPTIRFMAPIDHGSPRDSQPDSSGAADAANPGSGPVGERGSGTAGERGSLDDEAFETQCLQLETIAPSEWTLEDVLPVEMATDIRPLEECDTSDDVDVPARIDEQDLLEFCREMQQDMSRFLTDDVPVVEADNQEVADSAFDMVLPNVTESDSSAIDDPIDDPSGHIDTYTLQNRASRDIDAVPGDRRIEPPRRDRRFANLFTRLMRLQDDALSSPDSGADPTSAD